MNLLIYCRSEWEKHQERRRGIETHYNSTLEHLESIKCAFTPESDNRLTSNVVVMLSMH